jgi:hypothetical protein
LISDPERVEFEIARLQRADDFVGDGSVGVAHGYSISRLRRERLGEAAHHIAFSLIFTFMILALRGIIPAVRGLKSS